MKLVLIAALVLALVLALVGCAKQTVSVAEVCNTKNEDNLKVYQSAAVTVVSTPKGNYTCVLYHPYGERDVDQPMRIEAIFHKGQELRTQYSPDFVKSSEMKVVLQQARVYSEPLMSAATL